MVRELSEYFYADYGPVASTQLERLQRVFEVLTGLFDQVGIRTNTRKTVIMAYHPCHAPSMMSSEACEHQTAGTGPTFREQQWMRVDFPESWVEVAAGSLMSHHQSQHIGGWGDWGGEPHPHPHPQGRPKLTGSPS